MFSQISQSRPFRAAVGAVLAGGLVLGTSACSNSTTDIFYAPADGVRVALDTGIEVQNFMLISNGGGEAAVVGGAIKNRGTETNTATITADDGSFDFSVEIAGGQLANLTADNEPALTLPALAAQPGSTVPATLSDATGASTQIFIPVMDGTLEEFAPLVP